MKEVKCLDFADWYSSEPNEDGENFDVARIKALIKDGWEIKHGYSLDGIIDAVCEDGEVPSDASLEKLFNGLESEVNYKELSVKDSAQAIKFLSSDPNNILLIKSDGHYLAKRHTCMCDTQDTLEVFNDILKKDAVVAYLSKIEPNYKDLLPKILGKPFGTKTYENASALIDAIISPTSLLVETSTWEETIFDLDGGHQTGVFFALRMIKGKMEIVGCYSWLQAIEN